MHEMKLLQNYMTSKNLDLENLQKFSRYFDLLIEWNNKFNLTAITELQDVEVKHFVDSLVGNDFILGDKICDIGCGAGFPSIPLAIVNPHKNFVLIDSVGKKITFIQEVVKELGLDNVVALHSRIEDFAVKNFESFDCCVARAVAPLPTLAEYTLPLIKVGGKLVAYKGINYNEEVQNSQKILNILGAKIVHIDEYELADNQKRFILNIKKISSCPKKYPRGGNKPRISPII